MSCNCSNSPAATQPSVDSAFPGIQSPLPASNQGAALTGSSPCVAAETVSSSSSPGSLLPSYLTDAAPDTHNQGVEILARRRNRSYRFTGTGFLSLVNGIARIVQAVPLKISQLYHEFWKPAGINKTPIPGVPFPFALHVISDSEGNLFGIKGLFGDGIEHDSVHVYSYERQQWETKLVADFPLLQRGLAPRITAGELLAFPAIPQNGGSSKDVRQVSVLKGSGVIVLNQQPTIPSDCDCEGCTPVAEVASVASVVPFPEVDEDEEDVVYTQKWSKALGYHFVED